MSVEEVRAGLAGAHEEFSVAARAANAGKTEMAIALVRGAKSSERVLNSGRPATLRRSAGSLAGMVYEICDSAGAGAGLVLEAVGRSNNDHAIGAAAAASEIVLLTADDGTFTDVAGGIIEATGLIEEHAATMRERLEVLAEHIRTARGLIGETGAQFAQAAALTDVYRRQLSGKDDA